MSAVQLKNGMRDGPRTRQRMLDALKSQPGQTKTELMKQVGLAWGTTCYHLRVLLNDGAIGVRQVNRAARYYLANSTEDPRAIHALRQNLAPQLLALVRDQPGVGVQAISRQLACSRKSVSRRLQLLVEGGLVRRSAGFRARFHASLERTAIATFVDHVGPNVAMTSKVALAVVDLAMVGRT